MSNIVLNSLTYVGTGILQGVSWFWERSAGIVSAFRSLSCRINFADKRSNVQWKVVLPVTKAEDTACGCTGEVLRTAVVTITVHHDQLATVAERTATLTSVRDLVASTPFGESITSLTLPT